MEKELRIKETQIWEEPMALLLSVVDSEEYLVKKADVIDVRGHRLLVKEVDKDAKRVILRNVQNGSEGTLVMDSGKAESEKAAP